MDLSKLEFKITHDTDGKDVELDNLSVFAAKSLTIIIESLIKK